MDFREFIREEDYRGMLNYLRSGKEVSKETLINLIHLKYSSTHKFSTRKYKYEVLEEIIDRNIPEVTQLILDRIDKRSDSGRLLINILERGYKLSGENQWYITLVQSYETIIKVDELTELDYSQKRGSHGIIDNLVFNNRLTLEQRKELVLLALSKGGSFTSIVLHIEAYVNHDGDDDGRLALVLSVFPFPPSGKNIEDLMSDTDGYTDGYTDFVANRMMMEFYEMFPTLQQLAHVSILTGGVNILNLPPVLAQSYDYNLHEMYQSIWNSIGWNPDY